MPTELIEKARQGNRRAIARLLTRVERSTSEAAEIVKHLYPHTGKAHIIGITGAPGSGKSTLVNELAKAFRRTPKLDGSMPTVAIVAVDPSSPFTGGALLGDRIRMRDLSGDTGIFIRSMASRGSLGGLAQATASIVKVFDAVGFDVVLIETVGAGQAEVEIAGTAPTTIVIEAPGMGDDIQSIKAGILEIADILVVNKADNPNAKKAIKSLKLMLSLNPFGTRTNLPQDTDIHDLLKDKSLWRTTLCETVAINGRGIDDLMAAIQHHRRYLEQSGELAVREQERIQYEIEQLLYDRLMSDLMLKVPANQRHHVIESVAQRTLDPYSAVNQLYEQIQSS